MGKAYKYPSDIWAIGLVLLECAIGRFPYDISGVYLEMMQNIANGPSPSVPRQPDGSYGKHSKEFANFIDCCMCKDPDSRSTAEELLLHPWFKKMSTHHPRTLEQMREWVARVKARIDTKTREERRRQELANGDRMDTSTTSDRPIGLAQSTSSASSHGARPTATSQDPFEQGYNNTTTSGGATAGQQDRNNIPNSQSSFYQVKEIR